MLPRGQAFARCSASRIANATTVRVGFENRGAGNTAPLHTKQLRVPCSSSSGLTTPYAGLAAIRIPPM